MKVQLVVVRGKPEGKVIPLVGTSFKIGRGETCHLRPNSEQVSREHAEFSISDNAVLVRDLGSRNGTLVNGKALTAECRLKDRDLVQVGPLTFAVSISEVPAPAAKAAPPAPKAVAAPAAKAAVAAPVKAPASPDDVSGDEIDSWLFGDSAGLASDKPTAVYGGDTITITAFKDASASPPKAPPPPSASDDEYERQPEEEEDVDDAAETADAVLGEKDEDESDAEESEEGEEGEDEEEDAEAEVQEEFLDESNPFYAAKKAQKEQAKQTGPAKPSFKDTSDAAGDILRRLMERRRAEKNG
jgi:pSer/pThr/pTyr-binding forkhead associated (FHA) protein